VKRRATLSAQRYPLTLGFWTPLFAARQTSSSMVRGAATGETGEGGHNLALRSGTCIIPTLVQGVSLSQVIIVDLLAKLTAKPC